jgi:hypothetical protein
VTELKGGWPALSAISQRGMPTHRQWCRRPKKKKLNLVRTGTHWNVLVPTTRTTTAVCRTHSEVVRTQLYSIVASVLEYYRSFCVWKLFVEGTSMVSQDAQLSSETNQKCQTQHAPELGTCASHQGTRHKDNFKRGSVPPRCPLGSAILHKFFLRNGSN